jgi:hypothetical protein
VRTGTQQFRPLLLALYFDIPLSKARDHASLNIL